MKARFVAKTQGCAKTLPEDRSGEDTCSRTKTLPEDRSCDDTSRREDAGVCEDTSQRQVGRGHVSLRRHMGVRRHLTKTGGAKTRVVVFLVVILVKTLQTLPRS